MRIMRIGEFHQKQYDAETQWVARVAKSIQTENPDVDISWTECILLAEKALKDNKKENNPNDERTGYDGCNG